MRSEEDLEKIRKVRKRTKLLVSLGDCAVTGNVTAMRNTVRRGRRACTVPIVRTRRWTRSLPAMDVPRLLARVRPVHEVVKVDCFIPGCPPSADTIFHVLSDCWPAVA